MFRNRSARGRCGRPSPTPASPGTSPASSTQVTFVTEATATSPIAHRDAPQGRTVAQLLADPRTLPASAIIERTEYALAGRFATIATIAEAGVPAEPVR
jgi:hypothetical protein